MKECNLCVHSVYIVSIFDIKSAILRLTVTVFTNIIWSNTSIEIQKCQGCCVHSWKLLLLSIDVSPELTWEHKVRSKMKLVKCVFKK